MRSALSGLATARVELSHMELDPTLEIEENIGMRSAAVDRIAFIETVASLREDQELLAHSRRLRGKLEAVDRQLFARLRAELRRGDLEAVALRRLLNPLTEYRPQDERRRHASFELLDEFVAGLFLQRPAPQESFERDPEMVFYEPAPAAVILELIDRTSLGPGDLFYDLGSGLGQVAVLVRLLSGARVQGIEIQPFYAKYANQMVRDLNLDDIEFITGDAQEADLGGGSHYFLFTPFTGRILDRVMGRLYEQAKERPIVVAAFGPCVGQVALQRWLQPRRPLTDPDFRLVIFDSV